MKGSLRVNQKHYQVTRVAMEINLCCFFMANPTPIFFSLMKMKAGNKQKAEIQTTPKGFEPIHGKGPLLWRHDKPIP